MNKTNRRELDNNIMNAETLPLLCAYHDFNLADFYNTPNQNKTAYTCIKALNHLLIINSCMNPIRRILTLLIFILVAIVPISAQLSLLPDTSITDVGGKAEVNIRVKNFKNLTGMQFSLYWNPAILKYDTVTNFNLPGLSADMIGADPDTLAAGKIGLLWTSFQPLGNMMSDGSTMLTFVFDVIGKKGESTLVQIGDSPVFSEAYDTTGADVGVNKGIGKVSIKFPVNNVELYSTDVAYKLFNPDPNPFVNNTKISWEMPEPGTAAIIISDLTGKQVFQHKSNFNKGKNFITLDRNNLPAPGNYVITMKSNNTTLSRKLIFIK